MGTLVLPRIEVKPIDILGRETAAKRKMMYERERLDTLW